MGRYASIKIADRESRPTQVKLSFLNLPRAMSSPEFCLLSPSDTTDQVFLHADSAADPVHGNVSALSVNQRREHHRHQLTGKVPPDRLQKTLLGVGRLREGRGELLCVLMESLTQVSATLY